MFKHSPVARFLLTLAVVSAGTATLDAQVVPPFRRHQPLDQATSPGVAAQWAGMSGRVSAWMQPIRIIVDGEAEVSVYHGRPIRPATMASPFQLGVQVGHSYRLRISQMPQLPGVEIYPTIEVIDRLHPPAGQKHNFPIPVHIDRSDIELALGGNLVTRVVYLEQPQLAAPFELDEATRTRDVEPNSNALSEADRYGRPMVIVRIGGRLPSPRGEPAIFFGTGGPVTASKPMAPPAPAAPETNPAPAASNTPALPMPVSPDPAPSNGGALQ